MSSVAAGASIAMICGFDDLGDQIGVDNLDMKLDHIDEGVELNVSSS
jgi:hypothetical protein